jgi:hypothetical protein
MKKIILGLILIISFSNVMAKTMLGTSGSESFGQKIQGGGSGDLYPSGSDGGGGRSISGEGGVD